MIEFVACGKPASTVGSGAPRALVLSDLSELSSLSSTGPQEFDRTYKQLFTRSFGGTSGDSIRKYIDDRIRDYIEDNPAGFEISPAAPQYTGWTFSNRAVEAGGAVMIAANLGVQYWVQGLLDGKVYSLGSPSGMLTVGGPAQGAMLIGSGYKATNVDKKGNTYKIVREVRQATLVHEATHSNCEEITESDLDVIRSAKSQADFINRFTNKKCGHFHVLCPKTHPLAGFAACDDHPFGSYGQNAIYLDAIKKNYAPTSAEWQQINSALIDQKSRLLFSYTDMIEGRLGDPNPSTAGQVK